LGAFDGLAVFFPVETLASFFAFGV